jgi:hypothetical protein
MALQGDDAQAEARFDLFRDSAILTHMMELLGDVGHVESHFSPFGDSVSLDAR